MYRMVYLKMQYLKSLASKNVLAQGPVVQSSISAFLVVFSI